MISYDICIQLCLHKKIRFKCLFFNINFQHPFIANATDPKPILDLLAEFKAEIIEEEIADVNDEKSDQVKHNL